MEPASGTLVYQLVLMGEAARHLSALRQRERRVLMRERTPLDSAAREVALGTPVYVMGLNRAVALRWIVYSVLLLFLAAGVFSALVRDVGSRRAWPFDWVTPVVYLVAYLCTLVAHELVHGVFFRLFGGRPRYGAGAAHFVPYFFATSTGSYSPRQMTVISLAPLLVLSVLSLALAVRVPALSGCMAVAFVGNVAGAVGDIWMAGRLVGFFPFQDAVVVDTKAGLAVYSEDAGASEVAARFSARDRRPQGFINLWVFASVGMFVLGALGGVFASFFTDSLLIGPRQFPLVAFEGEPPTLTIGFIAPVAAGLVFALMARLFSRARQQEAPSTGGTPRSPSPS
jgi:hypothetical protein